MVSLRIVYYKGHQYNTILDLNANCGIFHWRKLIRPIAFIQVNKKSWEEKKKKKFKTWHSIYAFTRQSNLI